MYKIIGGDQKEYGPVSADQVRQWLAEGRANGQTPVQAEGSTDWRPLASYPEFAAALAVSPAAAVPPPLPGGPAALPPDINERDYNLDIGSCINRSWELLKQNFWPLVGVTFIAFVAASVINQVIGLISRPAMQAIIENRDFSAANILLVLLTSLLTVPVTTVMYGGLYLFYLKLIRGGGVDINGAVSGMVSALGPLVLLGFVMGLLVLLGWVALLIPGIYLGVAWAFAIPLVVDKRMDFWSAMELSRKVVTRHWFVVFALVLVAGLVSACGLVACCIGIFATVPIGLGAKMYAYEEIFSRQSR